MYQYHYRIIIAPSSSKHTHLSIHFAEELVFKSRMGAALVSAAAEGDASTVAMLLSQGARVDAREQSFTPLLVAAQFGHTEVCELLLAKGRQWHRLPICFNF